jgi:hypothetical protein
MSKRQYPYFEITYWGEDDTPREIIQVRAVPLRSKNGGLTDVIKLQEKLLRDFVECGGRIGDLLIREDTWNTMNLLAGMLPVVGKSEFGFDIEALADASDLAQLARIFFSEGIDDNLQREKDKDDNVLNSPSLIAKIHDINFSETLSRLVQEKLEANHQDRMKKLEEKLEKLEEPQLVAETTK